MVKRGGDELLLAISMSDNEKVEEIINSGVDINYRYDNKDIAPITLALKLGDPKIITLLIENNADLNSLNESGLSAVNYLFSENDVETINQVIPHIDREKYEDLLGYYIVNGLHVEVKKKYRKLAVSEQQVKREEKIIDVAKYIVNELANQKNITTALSYLCRGTAVQYRGVYNDAFDYLRPYLKVMAPEAAIGCVSVQDNPIGSNGKYVIENMLSLIDSSVVNKYIDASNMDKGYGFESPRKKERKKSPAEVWEGMRLLDIAASRSNEVAVYYLLEASADTSLMSAQKSSINKYKAELVGKVNNIFNGADEDVSDIDLETELSRTMSIKIDPHDRLDRRTIYFEKKMARLKELGVDARHTREDGGVFFDSLYWDYNDSPLKFDISLHYFSDEILYSFSVFHDNIKRNEIDLRKDYAKWKSRFFAGIIMGDLHLVEKLHKKGMNVSLHTPPQIRHPLILAYRYNHKDIFDYLKDDHSYQRSAKEIESGKYDYVIE